MKAILFHQAEITSIRSRVDHSIGFSVSTGEMGDDERAAFFALHGANVKILIEPHDHEDEAPVEVKGETQHKTCSQRLRAVLFVAWSQQGKPGTFEQFYESRMNHAIEKIKQTLEP